jgi:DNA-binding transcriptional LysR family regulator
MISVNRKMLDTTASIADPAVKRGELVKVLQAYGGRSRQFSILYPQNRHLSARVRAFVDFMLGKVRPGTLPTNR